MITNLKNITIVNPNYIACLMWKDQYGNVYRYQLWSNIGETVPLGFPLYDGQLIRKNFRIEIWSISGQNVTEAVGENFITSVLQGIDYRYGNDGTIGNNDGLVTNFSANASSITNFPASLDAFLQVRWLASSTTNGQPWVSADVHHYSLTSAGFVTASDSKVSINPIANIVGSSVSAVNITPAQVFIVCYFPDQGAHSIYNFDSLIQTLISSAGAGSTITLTLEDGNFVTGVPTNTWIIVEVGYSAGQSFVRYFNLLNRLAYTLPATSASTTTIAPRTALSIAAVSTNFYIADIEIYGGYLGVSSSQLVLTYLYNRYNYNFLLPLTFPANSSPQPNTV